MQARAACGGSEGSVTVVGGPHGVHHVPALLCVNRALRVCQLCNRWLQVCGRIATEACRAAVRHARGVVRTAPAAAGRSGAICVGVPRMPMLPAACPEKMCSLRSYCEAWGKPQAVRYVPIAFPKSLDLIV